MTTLQKLSRGRAVVALSPPGGQGAARIFTAGSKGEVHKGLIFRVESADQLAEAGDARIEVWAAIDVPSDRAAWAGALGAYEAVGATGVIVPWNERVLDLLRNPDPDDRSDLLMSTG